MPVVLDTPTPQELPPRLEEALQQLVEPAFRARLRRVFQASANAIHRLSDLDLVRYESHAEADASAADLSLWEEMAPVIRDTVIDVNALLAELRAAFPEDQEDPSLSAEAGAAVRSLHDRARDLGGSLGRVAEMMRDPAVMADRWNLLTEVQSMRSRLREDLGGLVFDAIAFFSDVRPREVIPGYVAELKSAIGLRAISADLLRIITSRLERVQEAEAGDLATQAQQLQTELDTFGRTGAYRSLRAQDKRHIVEFRARVGELAGSPSPARARLVLLVQEVYEFVVELQGVNQRPILQEHDLEVMARVSVKLEQAEQLLAFDPEAGNAALAEALAACQALYGRLPSLDVFLRRMRRQDVQTLPPEEGQRAAAQLAELLAELNAT
ncbi:MAG TPA: hypothetical protein VK013_08550 [Myxococcaceae bacterium]|nr:hypothetical protein [Myxococcaceae bacterium]